MGSVFAGVGGGLGCKNAPQVKSRFWSGIALLMTTTEFSQQIYLDALIFLILWVSGLGLSFNLNLKPAQVKPKIASLRELARGYGL